MTLRRGWHLLGSTGCVPYEPLPLSLVADAGDIGDTGYLREGRRLTRVFSMAAGAGVWVIVKQNGTEVELAVPE